MSARIGCGNAGAVDTTDRCPPRLGPLAHPASGPHSHSRVFTRDGEPRPNGAPESPAGP